MIEEGQKITDFARSTTSLTALFHGYGSHLKLLECPVDGTGEVVSGTSTPAEERYIVLSAKRNRRSTAHQVANQFLAEPKENRSPDKTVARRLPGELRDLNIAKSRSDQNGICVLYVRFDPDSTVKHRPFAMVSGAKFPDENSR
ncbi:hypothetical protein TNCV_1818221 [Trichonephila clavipes]|nr:hypothetical protein TNCV_1818221 [Trichonephila clavipes]